MNTEQQFAIEVMELGPMENFIYLIKDLASNRCAVVDPAWEPQVILKKVAEQGLQLTDILLTHSHHDHINGIEAVLKEHDAQVHLCKAELEFWGQTGVKASTHHGGEQIMLGNTPITILHTPGHTPGSACFHIGKNLIAGDTLFVFGCGRCDLAGGDPNEMFHTLKKITTELPAETLLYPGHNYSVKETSTISEQIQGNPFLHFERQEDFVRYRMHEHDKIRHSPYGPVPEPKH